MSRSVLYSSHHPFLLLVFIAAFMLVVTTVFLELTGAAFMELGLGRIGAALVIGGSLLGSFINIPILRIDTEVYEPAEEYVRAFGKLYRVRRVETGGTTVLAINVGGALIPSLVSVYLLLRYPMLLPQAMLGIAVVSVVAHVVARPTRGVGVVMPAFIGPVTAAVVALFVPSSVPYVIAYVSGVLGTLIGADLTHLASISKLGAGVASIGGAGTFDGVFLSGILAVLLA